MTQAADPLRAQLVRALAWDEAHVGFDKSFADIAPDRRGARPPGFAHSLWQLLEHLRLAQKDLLTFARDPKYVHTMTWPDDYWPKDPAPPTSGAWDTSLADFRADREHLRQLIQSEAIDLHALVPTGTGEQTYLRAIMLVIDHNAYHLGQVLSLRRALGIWQ
jgi:uncharacterized damage-inducible protein DinB